jgi:NAD-dependent DNA ligase/DNA polymerase/3'-5' exonuclease PolX
MSYNEIFAGLLSRLATAMLNSGEQMKAKAYKSGEEAILAFPSSIRSIKDIDKVPKIGPSIKEKLKEYLETGKIKLLEEYENRAENIFINVYGIGPKKSADIVKKGILTIADLREHQGELLNDVQRTGLKYYEDILKRIPRAEIDLYDKSLKAVLRDIKGAKYEIVGSYRRGQRDSGDIDVILTAAEAGAFDRFLDVLIKKGIIVEVLSRGKNKCLVIAKIPKSASFRRVDFLYATPEEYPFSVLYFTGSKGFNVVMRGYSLSKGYSLNEHGFTPSFPGKKITEERDIFDALGLQYKSPEERVDGRAVIPISNDSPKATIEAPNGEPEGVFDSIQILEKPVEEVLQKTRKKREPKKDRQKKVIKEILDKAPEAPSDSQRTVSDNILLSDKPEMAIEEEVLPKKKDKTRKKREPKEPKKKAIAMSPVIVPVEAPKAQENILLSDKPEMAIEEEVLPKKNDKTRKKREPKEPKKDRQKKVIKEILDEAPKAPSDSQRRVSDNILLSDKSEMVAEEVLPKKNDKTRKKREPKEPKKKAMAMSPVIAPLEALTAPKAQENILLSDKPEMVAEEVLPKKKDKTMKKSKEKELETETVSKEIMDIVIEFKQKGLPVLEPLSKKVLEEFVEFLDDSYYNENPLLTDNEYDIVKEYKEKKFPSKDTVCKIGAPIKGKNKVTLPFEMASMDKIKPDSGALSGWTAKYKGPYLLSCKLDGVSGLYECNQKGEYKLYTRGDGCVGQDISHLIRALELPKIPIGMAVRGEFILSKSIFKEKYASKFANARNLVSGIVNSKEGAGAKDLHFVAYEVIQPLVKPSEQMRMLEKAHFRVVQNELRPILSNESLSELLVNWRTSYEYEIDGVIVTNDAIHPRVSGNPEYAFAFKMVLSDQLAEAKVVDVLWEASKDGYLKPRVRIEPIKLGGVTIEYATGFNGKFIEENKIGIGALIQMVRSGDVIPYIKSVTVPAEKAKMPLVPYIWNKTHVDVLLENPHEDEGVQEKNITSFFVTIGVDGLAKGGVHKLYKAGKTTIADILKMTAADFEKIDGFQKKTATKLTDGIREKLSAASLLTIMVASGKMGRGLGERKIQPILEALPDILTSQESPEIKETNIKKVPGIGPENAREFVKNIPAFLGFLKETGLENKLSMVPVKKEAIVEGPLTGKKIVMTKVRDQDIISFVTNQGGSFEDSMKKDVMVLIVKSKEDVSNKTEYATKNGIPIMTVEEFKKEYM